MAINNFRRAHIEGGDLVVGGGTFELGDGGIGEGKATLPTGSGLHVTVIAVDDPFKRCEMHVDNPTSFGWDARSVGDNPFVDHDHVLAVGAQTAPDGSIVLVWANELCVGAPDPQL